MKTLMTPQEHFSQIARPEIQRSTFDRSHGYKSTFDAGQLIPFYVDEALPGDTFKAHANIFGRMATPIKPIMDNLFLDVHFFSVPIRLVWDNWKKFNGEQKNPGDSTNFIMPTTKSNGSTGYLEKSLADYMGIPTKIKDLEHRADFFRAYNLIWNEWYRDENLQNSVTVATGDGPDADSLYQILPRGKRKDYFTSALPWAQKAQPVSIPLGSSAPLKFQLKTGVDMSMMPAWIMDTTWKQWNGSGTIGATTISGTLGPIPSYAKINQPAAAGNITAGADKPVVYDMTSSHSVDLANATAVTINALRQAFQIQRMYEKDARGGTRYTELLRSHFGVISPDARLQRPEYLGGGTSAVNINPIAQTAPSVTAQTPQGNLAAMGTFSLNKAGFTKSFTEHEIIIGLASIRADLNYQQGLNRMWSRKTRFDFYWPSLAHLGEQAILNKEIYSQGASVLNGQSTPVDEDVFGYQERYAEYRYKPSIITGLFRSNATATLDVWHLAQKFTTLPALNNLFIIEQPPIARVIATPAEPQFIMDVYMKLLCARPMPTFATPGLIDHF